MPRIDLPTLFVVSTALFALMAAMFAMTWSQDRTQNRAMLPWAIAHGLAVPACLLFAARGTIPGWASIGLANALTLVAYGLLLSGARLFAGRTTSPMVASAGAILWIAACTIQPFWESFPARVGLLSFLAAAYLALAAAEIGRDAQSEPLPTRRVAAAVLGTIALAHVGRVLLAAGDPLTEDIAAAGAGWIAFIGVQILLQTVLAGYALMALVKERGEYHQRRTAEVDSLTGVFTRRAFFARAGARLADDPTRGALLIFDLDRFKAINDTHGHIAGDRVLGDFAAVAERHLGPEDVLGRLGGEEFALFLADADVLKAWRVAEAIRRDFAETRIRHDGRTITATVSVGVAAVPLIEPFIDRLMASADAGLYAAKAAGRDRVEAGGLPASARASAEA